jgi:hypothetical protein
MVRCRDATAINFANEFWGEVFARFHAVTIKRQVVCTIDCLACQDEFFVITKKIMSIFLTSLFICLALFGLGDFALSVFGSCILPQALA